MSKEDTPVEKTIPVDREKISSMLYARCGMLEKIILHGAQELLLDYPESVRELFFSEIRRLAKIKAELDR